MKTLLLATAFVAATSVLTVQAQENRGAKGGAVGGAAAGAVGGAIVGGPVGAAAGAVIGGAAGATAGGLTDADRTYVRGYVVQRPVDNVVVQGDVAVGARLPGTVRYGTFSGQDNLRGYRYARVNQNYVVVDANGNIVEIIR